MPTETELLKKSRGIFFKTLTNLEIFCNTQLFHDDEERLHFIKEEIKLARAGYYMLVNRHINRGES